MPTTTPAQRLANLELDPELRVLAPEEIPTLSRFFQAVHADIVTVRGTIRCESNAPRCPNVNVHGRSAEGSHRYSFSVPPPVEPAPTTADQVRGYLWLLGMFTGLIPLAAISSGDPDVLAASARNDVVPSAFERDLDTLQRALRAEADAKVFREVEVHRRGFGRMLFRSRPRRISLAQAWVYADEERARQLEADAERFDAEHGPTPPLDRIELHVRFPHERRTCVATYAVDAETLISAGSHRFTTPATLVCDRADQ